jgi:hypothetical protein
MPTIAPAPPAPQAAIAGGSFISMLFNLSMRHPWDPGRPLVDLDLALVLTPALLLGVSVGAAAAASPCWHVHAHGVCPPVRVQLVLDP